MNIVKGVADLIRRTSSIHNVEPMSGSTTQRFPLPSSTIRFSDVGDEAILSTLWEKYENSVDKVEKRKYLSIFLKQFLAVFKNWEPVCDNQFLEASASEIEDTENADQLVVGCSIGHPSEIILALTEELTSITVLVNEMDINTTLRVKDQPRTSMSSLIISDGLLVLDAMNIMARSMHNCRVLGYYCGIQRLTALMKASVVQLKTITGSLSADENAWKSVLENINFLETVLVNVVSILCNFLIVHQNDEKLVVYGQILGITGPVSNASSFGSNKGALPENRQNWHRKAVMTLMEAGGLNWLVELLRVMRRLSIRDECGNISLQHLTLKALRSALADNTRGQSHFRSIGGLEVLLDSLGLPSNIVFRDGNFVGDVLNRHVLSLEVLRESVYPTKLIHFLLVYGQLMSHSIILFHLCTSNAIPLANSCTGHFLME